MKFYVIPTIGQFKITITSNYDFYDKSKINNYVLNVGGTADKCVNITIPGPDSPKANEFILSWAEVLGKSCTVDSQAIKGDSTVEMVQLAFTIAKEIAPYGEYVTLKDMSYFICNTPDGKKKVSLPPYHIAFNDKTWYEDKFGAVLKIDYELYRDCVSSMHSSKKPSYFEFGNSQIKEILLPYYVESNTWKEFFQKIEKYHPRDKCILMYPWIENAMATIFKECGGGDLYTGKDWIIDLTNIPKIHYYQINNSRGGSHGGSRGGSRGSSRGSNCSINDVVESQYFSYRDIDYDRVSNWDILRFIQNKSLKKRIAAKKRATKRVKG